MSVPRKVMPYLKETNAAQGPKAHGLSSLTCFYMTSSTASEAKIHIMKLHTLRTSKELEQWQEADGNRTNQH